jgi:hypothetical protein
MEMVKKESERDWSTKHLESLMEMEERARGVMEMVKKESEGSYVTPLILDAQYLEETPTQGKPPVI